jgi:hypothetical protein
MLLLKIASLLLTSSTLQFGHAETHPDAISFQDFIDQATTHIAQGNMEDALASFDKAIGNLLCLLTLAFF